MDISERIVDIIKSIKPDVVFSKEQSIREMGINSIQYVQILVNLEEYFDFEFPDEFLLFSSEMTILELEEKIKLFVKDN